MVTGDSTPSLADIGLDHKAVGDIIVFADEGRTFLPLFFGHHGHPLAQPNVLLVAGGHPWLVDGPNEVVGFDQPSAREPADPVGRPSILSVAPTASWLFDLPALKDYANGPLEDAFDRGEDAP